MTVEDDKMLELERMLARAAEPLSPEAQARIDELSKDLLPGEDLLHYDVDRLYPPPEAGPSDVVEQAVQPMRQTAGPKTRPDGRWAIKRQNGKRVPSAMEPRVEVPKKATGPDTVQMPMKAFVAVGGRQQGAVWGRKVQRAVPLLMVLGTVGVAVAAWAMVGGMERMGVDGDVATAASTGAAPAARTVLAVTTTTTPLSAAPSATAVVTAGSAESVLAPSAAPNIRPTKPMQLHPKPSFAAPSSTAPSSTPPASAPTTTPEPTAEPTVAPPAVTAEPPVATATTVTPAPPPPQKPEDDDDAWLGKDEY